MKKKNKNCSLGVIIFGSVFIKKIIKPIFKKKLKPIQTDRFLFESIFLVWVRFYFFGFILIKPNQTVFFLILIGLIGFFSWFGFFDNFFLIFSV